VQERFLNRVMKSHRNNTGNRIVCSTNIAMRLTTCSAALEALSLSSFIRSPTRMDSSDSSIISPSRSISDCSPAVVVRVSSLIRSISAVVSRRIAVAASCSGARNLSEMIVVPTMRTGTAKRTNSRINKTRSAGCAYLAATERGAQITARNPAAATSRNAVTPHQLVMFRSNVCRPRELAAISMTAEKRSIRSLIGSRISPTDNTTPTPPGSSATSVPWAAETTPFSVRATAKVTSAFFSALSACSSDALSIWPVSAPAAASTVTTVHRRRFFSIC
jgi:hypothetical protein